MISPLEIAGWIVLAALAFLLVLQSRAMRGFRRPGLATPDAWPSLSVVLFGTLPDKDARRLVAEVVAGEYPGELEILLPAHSTEQAASLTTLTIASSRARVVPMRIDARGEIETVAREANGEWLLVLPPSTRLETDGIKRFVSDQTAERTDAALLLPRLESSWRGVLREPMAPWLRLTFAPLMSASIPYDQSCAVLVKRESVLSLGTQPSLRCVDGFDTASRPALNVDDYRNAIAGSAGQTVARRSLAALAMVLLFALPLPTAIVTASFPWIIAAVVSYWLRLRVAARTGEPIPAAFLHPLAALLAASDLLRASSTDDERNSDDAAT